MAINRDFLTSIHGKKLALTADGHLVSDSKIMAVSPANPAARIVWFDDFLGDAILTPYNYQEGSDTAATFAISVAKGGVALLTTAASATVTMAVNGAQVDLGALNWYAGNGGLSFEARLKIDDITTVAMFMGFTDQTSALEMPWTISSTTYTSNADDSFGLLFDTAATTDTIRCVGTKATTDVTNIDTSDSWTADTWKRFRVECDTAGTAKYYIDGVLVATIDNAVTTTAALVPYVGGFARAASARAISMDYWHVAMDRS